MASAVSPERYRFGAFELQLDERRLLAEGTVIPLRPRAFDLLTAFVDRAGHLVTKDELLDRVWPGVVVEEAALHVQVSALRKVLGTDAIATVSGRGYRFSLPVATVEVPQATLKHNLPSQVTSFIGREQEIAQLKELVTTHRLVTLTGAGGAGKTRLAIEVAGAIVDSYRDGVWLVELAALADPALVPQALATVLAIKDQPGRLLIDTISEYLASKRMLLIVDNAEHLLEPCIQVLHGILRRSAQITILVTSRERLGIAGELTYRVPSLTVPSANESATPEALLAYEGVRLFVDRARLLRPDFEITTDNTAAVISICSRLDGIPLAIELAAPRLRSMALGELNQRLDQRFALLTDGSRAALPRHRTLRSVIDWSYDLLGDAERALFARASVFAGGWTLARAQAVCSGDVIEADSVMDLLTSLIDKSLVAIIERDGVTRYSMLETVRQYAVDRLRETGEQSQWQDRHLTSFLALAEKSLNVRDRDKGRHLIEEVANEHDNMRAALQWCTTTETGDGLRLTASLFRFWTIRARHLKEARDWHARMLAAAPSHVAPRERARVLVGAAILARIQGDYEIAERLGRQSVTLSREINEPRVAAYGLKTLASLATDRARHAEAQPLLVECLSLARDIGDRALLAHVLINLAVVAHALGDSERAFRAFDESLAIARDIGDELCASQVLRYRGRAACKEGMVALAEDSLIESLALAQALQAPVDVAKTLEAFAELALAKRTPARAARIAGATERLRAEVQTPMPPDEQADYRRAVAVARAAMDRAAFETAWNEGREMTLEDAVKYALSGKDTPHRG
jgi:non-specific serine/threonine protein kinase